MLQVLESAYDSREKDREERAAILSFTRPAPKVAEQPDDGLLATAAPLMAGAYAVALAAAVAAFMSDGEALFSVVISIGFGLIYFTIPILMTRMRARVDARWHSDAAGRTSPLVGTLTGTIRRFEALAQMVVVPFAVGSTFLVFALIWSIVSAG